MSHKKKKGKNRHQNKRHIHKTASSTQKVGSSTSGIFKYQVGKLYHPLITNWEDGMRYSYEQGSHRLLITFRHIQPSERNAMRRGMCWFGLCVEEDIIFLLFKIDDPNGKGIGWYNIPYSWHLVPEKARTLPPDPQSIPLGEGAVLTIFLIEASTGILEAMRVLNWSNFFTRQLYQAIYEQAAKPFCGKEEYSRRIARIYQKFPSPESMATAASAKCLGGIYEGPPLEL